MTTPADMTTPTVFYVNTFVLMSNSKWMPKNRVDVLFTTLQEKRYISAAQKNTRAFLSDVQVQSIEENLHCEFVLLTESAVFERLFAVAFPEKEFKKMTYYQLLQNFASPDNVMPHERRVVFGVIPEVEEPIEPAIDLGFSFITDKLYVGGVDIASDEKKMKELGITTVVNCTKDIPCFFVSRFHYLRVPVSDDWASDISAYFTSAFDFIDGAVSSGNCVLIHCYAGISRSVTILAMYLMKKNRMKALDALKLIQSKRKQAYPNELFYSYLEKLEKQLGL